MTIILKSIMFFITSILWALVVYDKHFLIGTAVVFTLWSIDLIVNGKE